MILSTTDEILLYAPAHAIDHIEPLTGIINSAEYETLRPLLGQPLYDKLCEHYATLRDGNGIAAATERQRLNQTDDYYERLLFLAQPVVAFKTIESAIALQVLSINNAGINYATADDYPKADAKGIEIARTENLAQHHAAANRLLEELEQWHKLAPSKEDASEDDADLLEIATLWKQSRYFYLAAQMLLPSATVLEQYLPFHENREKYILLLPDLRYVQEEQIAPAIGEDFCEYLTDYALRQEIGPRNTASSRLIDRIVHRLRKIEATLLESRTKVLKIDKERRIAARDEGVRLLGALCDTISRSQEAILTALGDDDRARFETSPLYTPPTDPEPNPASDSQQSCCCAAADTSSERPSSTGMLVTEPLL